MQVSIALLAKQKMFLFITVSFHETRKFNEESNNRSQTIFMDKSMSMETWFVFPFHKIKKPYQIHNTFWSWQRKDVIMQYLHVLNISKKIHFLVSRYFHHDLTSQEYVNPTVICSVNFCRVLSNSSFIILDQTRSNWKKTLLKKYLSFTGKGWK